MLSYTGRRNLFAKLSGDNSTTGLALADTLMNAAQVNIYAKRRWPFLETTQSITTVASQQGYALKNNFFKLLGRPYITIGTQRYQVKECTDRQEWDRIHQSSTTSNIPEYCIIMGTTIYFWPTPSTAALTITIPYQLKGSFLTAADYTTGTITTATNGSTAIVGNGTVWTDAMVGRWIQIPASQSGDNMWYQIAARVSNTAITLAKEYQGASIVAGTSTYTIGEMSYLPEEFDMLPVHKALQTYFSSVAIDVNRAKAAKTEYDELLYAMTSAYGSRSLDPVLEGPLSLNDIQNPNLTVFL